jgi:3-keto-disaccharide hydrolase
MPDVTSYLSRRMFVKLAAIAAAGSYAAKAGSVDEGATAVLFDGKSLDGWIQIENKPPAPGSPSAGWVVKDGAMASTGLGRGVIYTAKDFGRFRLTFTMRHVSGNPDHQACVLIFCTRPQAGEKALDALGGIQFQVPNGGHWDYRPGMNNNGGPEFTTVTKTHFDPHEWSRVEILADATNGVARMAVAQPLGSKAVAVLDFNDPTAGKVGPIAWQMHNAGLFDEYKDVTIELDPADDDLKTIR